jgi:TetR/AcrR family transcriptional repressor of nem operon
LVRHTQTRERLVRTAGELFWTQGYAQTGVSSIMKHARATSGSFYHFFPTKDDLLLAVLDAVGDHLESEILQPAEEASNEPVRRVMALADAYRASVAPDSTTFGIPVGALTCELGTGHEPALRRLDEIYGWFTARVAEWFKGEQESRWGGLTGQDLAGFVIASLEGSASMAKANRDSGTIVACAQQLGLHMEAVSGSGPRQAERMPVPSPLGDEAGDWKAW